MKKLDNNFAYIDGANLHKAIQESGWELDYGRFRVWLKDRYQVEKAYLFIGLITKNRLLYKYLQEAGFILIFKETTYDSNGKPKGNCDAELVLNAVRDFYENNFDNVVLVTGDGDFACLANFFLEKRRLKLIVSPDSKKCSYLLRRIQVAITFLNGLKIKLGRKRKSPQ